MIGQRALLVTILVRRRRLAYPPGYAVLGLSDPLGLGSLVLTVTRIRLHAGQRSLWSSSLRDPSCLGSQLVLHFSFQLWIWSLAP